MTVRLRVAIVIVLAVSMVSTWKFQLLTGPGQAGMSVARLIGKAREQDNRRPSMNKWTHLRIGVVLLTAITATGCAGGPMTTREKGAGIGALGGAAGGALIGSAFGRPGAGAAIGAGVGLAGGALIGDRMQGQEQQQANQQTIQQNDRIIERNRQEIHRRLTSSLSRCLSCLSQPLCLPGCWSNTGCSLSALATRAVAGTKIKVAPRLTRVSSCDVFILRSPFDADQYSVID